MAKELSPWGKQCKIQMIMLDKSLEDIGKDTGLSRTYISSIINGRVVAPDYTVEAISKSLKIDAVPLRKVALN